MATTNALTVDMHTRSSERFRKSWENSCGLSFETSRCEKYIQTPRSPPKRPSSAATHGKFWDMHDLIFENQNSLSEQMHGELAHRLTLDRQAFRDALRSGTFAERVQADFSRGVRSGVNGTPTIFYQQPAARWRLRTGDASPGDPENDSQPRMNEMENVLPDHANILFDDPLSR